MSAAAADLPDDPETQKAVNAHAEARMARLATLLKALERARYGRSSEALDTGQRAFAFEEIETGLSAAKASLEQVRQEPGEKTSRQRKPLPAHLQRIEVVIEPDAAPCAWLARAIGSKSARMCPNASTWVAGKVPRHRHPPSALRLQDLPPGRRTGQGPRMDNRCGAPDRGSACPGRRLKIRRRADALSPGRDFCPRRRGAEPQPDGCLDGAIGIKLEPLADRVFHHIRRGSRIFADETTLSPGRGKTKTGWLWTYARDDRFDLDSNIVERAIRPQTITRKNALFAGSDGGGRTWATIATLLSTAKLNGVDPHAWLTKTLERLADDWPNRLIDDLMPWNHQLHTSGNRR